MVKENMEDFAYQKIISLILENYFKPGDFLLETELAQSLNISRTPVRHALGQLVAQGFLEKRKKKGCFIPSPTPQDAKDIFYVREHIEGLVAASAARQASDQEVEYLYGLIEKEKGIIAAGDSKQTKLAYINLNKDFHLGIADICGNPYLKQYCQHSFWRSHTYILFFDRTYLGQEGGTQEISPKQHTQIVNAIENRNDEKAGNLMRLHIRTSFEQLFLKF